MIDTVPPPGQHGHVWRRPADRRPAWTGTGPAGIDAPHRQPGLGPADARPVRSTAPPSRNARRAASSSGSPVVVVVPVISVALVAPTRTEAAGARSAAEPTVTGSTVARSAITGPPGTPDARPPIPPAQDPQHPSAEGRSPRARRRNSFREAMEDKA